MRIHRIHNVSKGDLESALHWINEHFKGNIEFNRCDEWGDREWLVTLHVRDRRAPGHMLSRPEVHGSAQPINAPCWHVQYYFFLELPDEALVKVGDHWYSRADGVFPTWTERRSLMAAYDITELCECGHSASELYNPLRRIRR